MGKICGCIRKNKQRDFTGDRQKDGLQLLASRIIMVSLPSSAAVIFSQQLPVGIYFIAKPLQQIAGFFFK
jgi:hypothetical protein